MAVLAFVPWTLGAALALPVRTYLPAYIPRMFRARPSQDRQTYA